MLKSDEIENLQKFIFQVYLEYFFKYLYILQCY